MSITQLRKKVSMQPSVKTVFAFDFDGTISRDLYTFLDIMKILKDCGHQVYVVSARRPGIHPEDFKVVEDAGFPVILSRHIAKRLYMREVMGIEVNVWVDDTPECITENWEGEPRTFRDLPNQ